MEYLLKATNKTFDVTVNREFKKTQIYLKILIYITTLLNLLLLSLMEVKLYFILIKS